MLQINSMTRRYLQVICKLTHRSFVRNFQYILLSQSTAARRFTVMNVVGSDDEAAGQTGHMVNEI